jgi:hypothetical protein
MVVAANFQTASEESAGGRSTHPRRAASRGTSPRYPGEQAAAQDEAMTGLTLDAGALIAFERNDPQVVALIVLADLIVV